MIPYQELAVALERWRVRTGLPTHATVAAAAPRPLLVPSSAPIEAPFAVQAPRTAPPSPPPGRATVAFAAPPPPAAIAPRAPTSLPIDELDAEVLDEEHVYDNEGNDFAVSFGGPPKSASGSIGGEAAVEAAELAEVADPLAELDDPFASDTSAVSADGWPEVAEAQNWQSDETNATAYGWGQGQRAGEQPAARPGTDPDDDGSTVVGSTKPR